MTGINSTFDNFKPVKGAEKALALFKELSACPDWFMLLCGGDVGSGKTHLCNALANVLTDNDNYCRVQEWPVVIRNLKRAMHSEQKGAYDDLFDRYQKAPVLVLDDVGMGATTSDWQWGELEEFINYRYENGLLTVVTTNLDLKQLPPRIVSRFSDAVKSRKVLNKAVDYRPLKGGNNERNKV